MELLELIEGDDVVRITADQRASPAHRKKPVKDILDFLRPSEADRTCAPRRKGGPTRTEPARRPRRWPGRGPQALGRGASLRGPRTACARPSRRSLPGRLGGRVRGSCSPGPARASVIGLAGNGLSAALRFSQRLMPTGEQFGVKLTQMRPEIADDCRDEDGTEYNNNGPSRAPE